MIKVDHTLKQTLTWSFFICFLPPFELWNYFVSWFILLLILKFCEFNIFIWKASFYLVEFEFQKSNIGGKPIDVLIIK